MPIDSDETVWLRVIEGVMDPIWGVGDILVKEIAEDPKYVGDIMKMSLPDLGDGLWRVHLTLRIFPGRFSVSLHRADKLLSN